MGEAKATSAAALIAEAELLGPEGALPALLRAWRQLPHPLLAEVIEAVAGGIDVEPLRGRTNKATAARFHELAEGRRDADLGALLAVFPAGGIDAGATQIKALLRWPRDPRLAAQLLALLEDPPYRSRRALPLWEAALQIVAEVADPRSRPEVLRRASFLDQSFAQPMLRLMGERLERLAEQLPSEAPALEQGAQRTLEVMLARSSGAPALARSGDRDALLAAIYADPENDELRLIYADACSAAGDPRGELIVLQQLRQRGDKLTPAQRKREQALLKEHSADWLGELSAVLLRSSVRLRLGLLDAATLKPKHDAHLRPLIGDPRWSTLRALKVSGLRAYYNEAAAAALGSVRAVILDPAMRSLRALTGELRPDLTVELCQGPTSRPLERLEVHNDWHDDEVTEGVDHALLEAPGLPRLKALIYRRYRCKRPADYGWLLTSALAGRLERLQLTADIDALADWVPLLWESSLAALILCDDHDYRVVELIKVGGGRLAIRASFKWVGRLLETLSEQLDRLDPGSVETLQVVCRGKPRPSAEQVERLRRAAERLQPARCKLP